MDEAPRGTGQRGPPERPRRRMDMTTIAHIAKEVTFGRIATLVVLAYSAALLAQMTGNVLAI